MNELVKQAHNSNANKNYAFVITKQQNIKQMQQQENAIASKEQQENNIHIKQTKNKRNCAHVTSVSFSNQRLQLL
jgi:hypothetical protein